MSIFAGVIHRDNGTPWPRFDMTTQRWIECVPSEHVRIEDLIATQGQVSIALLDPDDELTPFGVDRLPHVIRWNRALYLEDGHHRVIRAWAAGRETIRARVLDLDAHRYRICRQGTEVET